MPESGIVTFLFTDVVNSTRVVQATGEEAGRRQFRAHHKLISDAVATSGGQELQWLGEAMLAVFSSAADAVRCAIGVQQTTRRPIEGARYEIRVGIHAGDAPRRDGGYFGTAAMTARRLCDRASGGQILCSGLVAQLLAARQAFDFRDLGKLEWGSGAAPVRASEVVYERNDPAALLNRTPFVGREEQLKRLSVKLDELRGGHGAVAMLMGEPGIGKTRLIEEFADAARQEGAIVLRGACYEGEWQPPYGPFSAVIGDYVRRTDPATLAAELGERASILARIAPALRERLGDLPEPPSLEKEEERLRLLDAVAQLMIAIARRKPLVLVLDDLHWADRGTVGMLVHLAHFVSGNQMLVIGAYRDAEVDRKHPLAAGIAEIRRLHGFESLTLEGLAPDALAELLAIVGDHDPPEELVGAIGDETAGNPLFIREVLLHLVEEGRILREGQGWPAHVSIDELSIPEGVREVIGRRLMRLSDKARDLLRVGLQRSVLVRSRIHRRATGRTDRAGRGRRGRRRTAGASRCEPANVRFHSCTHPQRAIRRT